MKKERLENRREIESIERVNNQRIRAFMVAKSRDEATAIMEQIKADSNRLVELRKKERRLARRERLNPFKKSYIIWF